MKFALVFAACLAASAQSPLDVTPGLTGMVDRYLTGIARRQWEERNARVSAFRTPAEVKEWQAYIRRTMLSQIGGFPEKTPLNPRITGTLDRAGYRIEKLIFESQPRYYVTANLYIPTTGKPPYPAVLGTAGHTAEGKAAALYQRAWIGLAKRGFVVLAYDPPGQGERLEYLDLATGKSILGAGSTNQHIMAGIPCLLTGANMARYIVWDGIRAFDYLLTRKEVDPARIGVAGNSGGGTQTAYLAVFEERLAAAAPSCYITSWEKLWPARGPQDAEQVFPGFLRDGLDFPDFLIAFAPRPIQMAAAIQDYFPIDGARATYAQARRIFEILGAAGRAGYFEFDDTHGWSQPRREATYRWFARWLQNREDDGAEPAFDVEPVEVLNVTKTGQVAGSVPGARTTQAINADLAEAAYPRRAAASGKNIAALIRERLAVPMERGMPAWDTRGTIERRGYRIDKIEMQPELGITVPALAFIPEGGPPRRPAVLWVDAAGKAAEAGEGGAIEKLVRAGNVVLAVDPRGVGESAPAAGPRAAYTLVQRAFLTGRTLVGMQTGDVLRAFDFLASRREVDSRRIAVIGKGNGGVVALYAAALEPRIARVACHNSPASYMEIVRAKMHQGIMEIVVPGVLRDFDLPDAAASIAPRAVWNVSEPDPDFAAWLKR